MIADPGFEGLRGHVQLAIGVCAMMLLLAAAGTACGSDLRSESAAQTQGNGGTNVLASKSAVIPFTDDSGHPGPTGCGSMVDGINDPSAHGHLTPEAAARAAQAFPAGGRVESSGRDVRVYVGDSGVGVPPGSHG